MGGTEREMCVGSEDERMEKSMIHRKKNYLYYIQLYCMSRFASTSVSITYWSLWITFPPLCATYNEFMKEREMYYPHVLSLSVIKIPSLPCYCHPDVEQMRAVRIWMRSFLHANTLISHNCHMSVISCTFMNHRHQIRWATEACRWKRNQ